jgi:hypothetical protein
MGEFVAHRDDRLLAQQIEVRIEVLEVLGGGEIDEREQEDVHQRWELAGITAGLGDRDAEIDAEKVRFLRWGVVEDDHRHSGYLGCQRRVTGGEIGEAVQFAENRILDHVPPELLNSVLLAHGQTSLMMIVNRHAHDCVEPAWYRIHWRTGSESVLN